MSLVSNSDQRIDQNVLKNMMFGNDMMFYGIIKCTHTRLMKKLAVDSSVIIFMHGVRISIL